MKSLEVLKVAACSYGLSRSIDQTPYGRSTHLLSHSSRSTLRSIGVPEVDEISMC